MKYEIQRVFFFLCSLYFPPFVFRDSALAPLTRLPFLNVLKKPNIHSFTVINVEPYNWVFEMLSLYVLDDVCGTISLLKAVLLLLLNALRLQFYNIMIS